MAVNMLDFYVTIREETPEVVILDCEVLSVRLHLRCNCGCNLPLILFVNCD